MVVSYSNAEAAKAMTLHLASRGYKRIGFVSLDTRTILADWRQDMHPRPHLIRADALAVDAADAMERYRVTSLLVVDAHGDLVGAINTNDLLRAKVI